MKMNKIVFAALFASGVSVAVTASAVDQAEIDRQVMERFGGYVTKPGTPCGKIAIVNAQKGIKTAIFEDAFKKLSYKLQAVTTVFSEAESVSVGNADEMKTKTGASFAVFIVDDQKLPMSLIAPEAQWAILNIKPLSVGSTSGTNLELRARAEFARVIGLLCGGASSQFNSRIMNLISKPSDLDGCVPELPVDTAAKLMGYLDKHGVKAERKVFYQKACEEGWAAEPTNKFQKAVWDKVHQLPTKPIKIKYNKKKGE